jgi:hypothetical protein
VAVAAAAARRSVRGYCPFPQPLGICVPSNKPLTTTVVIEPQFHIAVVPCRPVVARTDAENGYLQRADNKGTLIVTILGRFSARARTVEAAPRAAIRRKSSWNSARPAPSPFLAAFGVSIALLFRTRHVWCAIFTIIFATGTLGRRLFQWHGARVAPRPQVQPDISAIRRRGNCWLKWPEGSFDAAPITLPRKPGCQ